MTEETLEQQTKTGAEEVRWNLQDLYADRAALDADLQQGINDAEAFAARHRGRLAGATAAAFADMLKEFEALQDRLGKAYTYAYLNWSTQTGDAARGALLQKVRETYTAAMQHVIFFELEWANLEEEKASELLQAEELASFRHYLEIQRLLRQYLLTEPEEKILSAKNVTGRAAWNRFFDETLGAARFDYRGEALTEQEVLAKMYDQEREVRRDAALALTAGLEGHLRELTFVFNTVLADKYSDDRLRGYSSWISSRNLSNEVSDEVVESLIQAVISRYDLVERFYEVKRKLLGLDEMYDYDRYAPIGEAETRYTWREAQDLVLDAYGAFDERMGVIARSFFEEQWIDAALAPGKRGGAFSHGAVPSAHPYILMNYTGKIRDVQTLAHELGHGVHQYLSRQQGVLQSDTPLTTAETASVFGEMLVFDRLIKAQADPQVKLSMLVGKIDDTIATVFRQVTMNRFEDRIHEARRNQGELSSEVFSTFWMETQQAMFRDSVTLGDHYRIWWSYIPHFVHTPGYVYAYAFGELLVLALYQRYQEEGDAFSRKYMQLLEAGGSDWPHVLVGRLGVDLTDTGFWRQGLAAIEHYVAEAEDLAACL